MKFAYVAMCVSLLMGCSALPSSQKVDAFGGAAAAGSTLLQNAATANRTLALRIGEEDQAARYVRGGAFTLADKPDAMLNPENFKPRLEALRALEAYGKALKLAADQGLIDQLEQASVNLGTAAGKFTTAGSPAAAPAVKLVSRSVGFLLGNAYAGEIQAVIVARDPDVRALAAALKNDLAAVSELLSEQAMDLRYKRKESLELIRKDPKVDHLRLYDEYKAARQEVATQAALAVVVGQYATVLDQLAEAHAALASGDPNAELTIKRFVALTNDLVDLVAAAAKQDDKKGST
ncbi:hypothetical protein FHR70_002605 [Microvirga lupini]|uniref:Uncharacterized protein n=1 Tax=Microvirga lupini TaxID=420324 RepID=A0A7W4VLT1_9HYPH|nr:hypothetical protein [Microvirga lupini]MBB3019540.1 hypothetical protein [Microvirga lupini]